MAKSAWDHVPFSQPDPSPAAGIPAERVRAHADTKASLPPGSSHPGTAQIAMRELEAYLHETWPGGDTAGRRIFMANTPAALAIDAFLREECEPGLRKLVHGSVDGAMADIGVQVLSSAAKDIILVTHLKRNFLGPRGDGAPIQAAVPAQAREFLRAVCDRVQAWAAGPGPKDSCLSPVLPNLLIARGVAASIIRQKPTDATSPDQRILEVNLARMLMALGSGDAYAHLDPGDPACVEVTAGLAALRPAFQAALGAVVSTAGAVTVVPGAATPSCSEPA